MIDTCLKHYQVPVLFIFSLIFNITSLFTGNFETFLIGFGLLLWANTAAIASKVGVYDD